MKKIIFIMLITLITSLTFSQVAEIPQNGDGTENNPYQIANLNNLYWLTQNSAEWDKYFVQISSFSAFDTQTWNSGEGFEPIGNDVVIFNGNYNGNYNTITDIFINRPESEKQAMFGKVGGVIQNLLLENVSITARRHIAALVGFAGWSASIQNCSSSGSITTTYDWAGGLIGYAISGVVVSRCSSSCNISGGSALGGLIGGTQDYCEIYDCYATGSVNGEIIKGGLIGNGGGNSSVNRSYSKGYVSTGNWSGGFIGDAGLAYDCFWDVTTSQQSSSVGGTGKSTADMKDVATFTNLITTGLDNPWDFVDNPNDDTANDDIWTIDPTLNNGYPILTWQIINADFTASPTEIILGDTIQFIDSSVGSPATWAWDFDGDDITDSTIENPNWEYTVSGTYTVKLTITDGRTEDTETKIDYITVNEPSLTRDLVAYYPFTGNTNDESGNAHNATNYGATPTTDRFGETDSAYDFDGSNDFMGLGGWFNYQDFTISLWVTQDAINSTYVDIIDNNHTDLQNWAVQYDGISGSYYFFTQPQGATEFDLPNNEWKNLVFIKDGTSLKMYMNNVLVDEITATSSEIHYSSQNLFIARWGGGGRYFNGKIDDIRMYDRALADVEIEMLYNESNVPPVYEMNLVSAASIDFGTIYYGLDNNQEVIIQNDGNVDLSVSDVSFSTGSSATFSYTYANLGGAIAPGTTDSIFVNFEPDAEGSFSGTLQITNNSTNNPLIEVALAGTGEYDEIPAPQNVTIVLAGGDATISWDAVTHTVHGIAITPDFYVINYNDDPVAIPDDYLHLTITTNLSVIHTGVNWFAEQMFYQVIAIRDYEGQYTARQLSQLTKNRELKWKDFQFEFLKKK